ncbi:MAG: KH domain-containing protein [Acidobacteriota bacterium]|nr:KH domain-containing protein [Acidobacteriota bacterium]
MSRAREVVDVMARALAGRPGDVRVTEAEHRGQTVVEVFMADGELGRIIGRQGRTAAAVRTVAAAAGELEDRRVTVEFRDA